MSTTGIARDILGPDVSNWTNISINLSKRSLEDTSSDYLISAIVSIIFLVFLSATFATLLFKWLNGPSPVFLLDDMKSKTENSYLVSFVTGWRSGRKMHGTVVFGINGTSGSSSDYQVAPKGETEWENIFSRCSHDFFHINTKDALGNLVGVSVSLLSKEKFQKWCLNYVTIHDLGSSSFHYFPFNRCFTAISGYEETVTAGKKVKLINLLRHNLSSVAKETFLWTCRFTTRHTDKPLDVLANVCLCYHFVSCLMLLLLLYVRLDQGNAILFSTPHLIALSTSIVLSAGLTTFFQLLYRSHSISSSSILKNFAPVRISDPPWQEQTSNNAFPPSESRLPLYRVEQMTSSVHSRSETDVQGTEDGRSNWNANNSSKMKVSSPLESSRWRGRNPDNDRLKTKFDLGGNFKWRCKNYLTFFMKQRNDKMLKSSQTFVKLLKSQQEDFTWKKFKHSKTRKESKLRGSERILKISAGKEQMAQKSRTDHFRASHVSKDLNILGAMETQQTNGNGNGSINDADSVLRLLVRKCLFRLTHGVAHQNVGAMKSSQLEEHLEKHEMSRCEVLMKIWNNFAPDVAKDGESLEEFSEILFKDLKNSHVDVNRTLHLERLDDNSKRQSELLSDRLMGSLPLHAPCTFISHEKQKHKRALLAFIARSFDGIIRAQSEEYSVVLENLVVNETETLFFKLLKKFSIPSDAMGKFFMHQKHSGTSAKTKNCFDFVSCLLSNVDMNTRAVIFSRINPQDLWRELWTSYLDDCGVINQSKTAKLSDLLSVRLIFVALLVLEADCKNSKFIFNEILKKVCFYLKKYHQANKIASLVIRYSLITFACSQLSSYKILCIPRNPEIKCHLCSQRRPKYLISEFLFAHHFWGEDHVMPEMNVICLLSHVMGRSKVKEARVACRCWGKSQKLLLSSSMRKTSVAILEKILWREVVMIMEKAEALSRDLFGDFMTTMFVRCRFDEDEKFPEIQKVFKEGPGKEVEMLAETLTGCACQGIFDLMKRMSGIDKSLTAGHQLISTCIGDLRKCDAQLSIDDPDLVSRELQVFARWFMENVRRSPNENNNNMFLRDPDLEPHPPSFRSPTPRPQRKKSSSLQAPSNHEQKPLSPNSISYMSINSSSNQNSETPSGRFKDKVPILSAFAMSARARDLRWAHFTEAFSSLPGGAKRILILASVAAVTVFFNILVLVCGDGHVSKEATNAWIVNLFSCCTLHFFVAEPLKIIIITILWTFTKRGLFQ